MPLDLDVALTNILAEIHTISNTEMVDLDQAGGRINAQRISSPVALPPFNSSAMDGYAFNFTTLPVHSTPDKSSQLKLCGTSFAGQPLPESQIVPADGCVRIMTGACVPSATDTVVPQEDCEVQGDSVRILDVPAAGANIRIVGHDVAQGAELLPAGSRLNPFDVSWLAACGIAKVEVTTKPTVAVFSTGDELQIPGKPLAPGQIYDSNRQLLKELLTPLPVEVIDLGRLPDNLPQVESALIEGAKVADFIVTSGGVSVGDADLVKTALENLGQLSFWRINIKPGKPVASGKIGKSHFFGLPGNPVSTAITFLLIARAGILKACGAANLQTSVLTAELAETVKHRPGREEFQRGHFFVAAGKTQVRLTGDQSSNRLATFRDANCLVHIAKDSTDLATGTEVEILPLDQFVG